MACGTTTGCFSLSLRRTCLVIGVVFLLAGLATNCTGILWDSSDLVVGMDGIFTIACVCLIIAAEFKNRFLCLGWFVGYACTVAALVLVFLADLLGVLHSGVEPLSGKAFFRVFLYLVRLVTETIALRYVYSYYVELRDGGRAQGPPPETPQ